MYRLKKAFEESRARGNIELVLPEILSNTLYVVGVDFNAKGEGFEFALTKSPKKGELCVTVSENPDLVTFGKWDLADFGGRELLQKVPSNSGILVVYDSGGDYLSREQINFFLSLLDNPV